MVRSTSVVVFLIGMSFGLAVQAQETGGNGSVVPTPSGNAPGQPLNSDHLAPTGKTLPHPGVPQASGTTASIAPFKSRMSAYRTAFARADKASRRAPISGGREWLGWLGAAAPVTYGIA